MIVTPDWTCSSLVFCPPGVLGTMWVDLLRLQTVQDTTPKTTVVLCDDVKRTLAPTRPWFTSALIDGEEVPTRLVVDSIWD